LGFGGGFFSFLDWLLDERNIGGIDEVELEEEDAAGSEEEANWDCNVGASAAGEIVERWGTSEGATTSSDPSAELKAAASHEGSAIREGQEETGRMS